MYHNAEEAAEPPETAGPLDVVEGGEGWAGREMLGPEDSEKSKAPEKWSADADAAGYGQAGAEEGPAMSESDDEGSGAGAAPGPKDAYDCFR